MTDSSPIATLPVLEAAIMGTWWCGGSWKPLGQEGQHSALSTTALLPREPHLSVDKPFILNPEKCWVVCLFIQPLRTLAQTSKSCLSWNLQNNPVH